jgi:hypothetical protein
MEGDVEVVASHTADLNRIGLHRIAVSFYWHSPAAVYRKTARITDLFAARQLAHGDRPPHELVQAHSNFDSQSVNSRQK